MAARGLGCVAIGGSGIVAGVVTTSGGAKSRPIARVVRSFVMCFTIGVRRL